MTSIRIFVLFCSSVSLQFRKHTFIFLRKKTRDVHMIRTGIPYNSASLELQPGSNLDIKGQKTNIGSYSSHRNSFVLTPVMSRKMLFYGDGEE